MAHTSSAKKRARQAVKRTLRNRAARSVMKTWLKKTQAAIDDMQARMQALVDTYDLAK